MTSFVAIDLGASSGRVTLGTVDGDALDHREVHRFANLPVRDAGLRWDVHRLHDEVVTGLRRATGLRADIAGIGIDSWGVDYGLLDDAGRLLDLPFHHREPRTAEAVTAVHAAVGAGELHDRTGLAHLPFTTVYQLAADRAQGRLRHAHRLLPIPDLIGFWLTGAMATDRTIASTTGLLDVRTGDWAADLLGRLGLPAHLLPEVVEPGTVLGPVSTEVVRRTGLRPGTTVSTVAGHDTASAVAAMPALDRTRSAYISCGTWSLVGLELDHPVLSDAGRRAGFTNERGVGGRIRFLRNVMGLWPLQEAVKEWRTGNAGLDAAAVVAEAGAADPGGPVIDIDDPVLLTEGDMLGRLDRMIGRTGRRSPRTRGMVARCILDGLAAAHARTLDHAATLTGREIDVVHLVGGGARNALLAQLTADRCGRPVTTGPVEAASLGNLLVQAMAHGALPGGLDDLRRTVARTQVSGTFRPRPAP